CSSITIYRNGALRGGWVRDRASAGLPFLDLRLHQAPVEKALLIRPRPLQAASPPTSRHGGEVKKDLLIHGSLDLLTDRVEGVELVQRRLGPDPVWVLRGLDRVEEQVDLFLREVQRLVDDCLLLGRAWPVDCVLDH